MHRPEHRRRERRARAGQATTGCPPSARALKRFKDDGFERINPSILKAAIQADYPSFDEKQIGFKRFSDIMKALEKEKLLVVEMDEAAHHAAENLLTDIPRYFDTSEEPHHDRQGKRTGLFH